MEKKESFILYASYGKQIKKLSTEQKAAFLDAIFTYVNGEELDSEMDIAVDILFSMVKDDLDADYAKYQETCERNRKNGALGGRPKKNQEVIEEENKNQVVNLENPKKPSGFSENPKKHDNDYDYDNDYDNDYENENDNKSLSKSKDLLCTTEMVRIAEYWNQLEYLGIPSVSKINSGTNRHKMLKARIQTYGVSKILAAMDNIKESPFLCGSNKNGWIINFDWFIKPNNFIKVLDGNYRARDSEKLVVGNITDIHSDEYWRNL